MAQTDKLARALQPGEWESHSACWLAWPAAANLWQENLESAQIEFVNLCRVISDWDERANLCRGEKLEVLVPDEKAERAAARALRNLNVRFHRIPYGDIWLRDIAPIFVRDPQGGVSAASFRFNGWGEKYLLPHDDQVAGRVAQTVGLPGSVAHDWILEGGSVDVDGQGTALTTEQCLLNPNRNPGLTREDLERKLSESLGVTKTLWIREGLLNDHTDGHVDTIARFVSPGVAVCMMPAENFKEEDPNARVLRQIRDELASVTDARGRTLQVVEIPSPGRVLDEEGEIMPASYVNFYIGNRTVAVPQYGVPADEPAVSAIAKLFPDRRTVGLSAKSILSGGGAFHCITQQQPAAAAGEGNPV
jgi:agmatine deiminase